MVHVMRETGAVYEIHFREFNDDQAPWIRTIGRL